MADAAGNEYGPAPGRLYPAGRVAERAVWTGQWVVWAGIVIGVICAINGFRDSMKAMSRLAGKKKKEDPPISFNDHDWPCGGVYELP